MPNSPVVPAGMPLPDTDEADGNANVAAAGKRDPLLTPPKPEPKSDRAATPAEKAIASIVERQEAIDAEIKRQQAIRSDANMRIAELREESKLNTRLINAARGRKRS